MKLLSNRHSWRNGGWEAGIQEPLELIENLLRAEGRDIWTMDARASRILAPIDAVVDWSAWLERTR